MKYTKEENVIHDAMAVYKANVGITSIAPSKYYVLVNGYASFFRETKKDCEEGIRKLKKFLPEATYKIVSTPKLKH